MVLLIEDEVQKVENASNWHIFHIIVEDVKHLSLYLGRLVYVWLEPQAVI